MPSASEPIIVLGAARSGTKMLRDTLAAANDLGVVKYDVNYVWRVGNERFPHDALPPDLATPQVRKFVRAQLPRISHGLPKSQRFIEKTVGNVLRLPFVHRIYPNAKYVFLIRDGRDVTESAIRCWQSPAKLRYLAAKLSTFPWQHGARYAASYAKRFFLKATNLTPHLSSWGPRHPEIEAHVRDLPLWQVCAHQWIACMEAYEQSKSLLAANQIIEIRYEDIIANPVATFRSLCDSLEIDDQASVIHRAQQTIVAGNIGKRSQLSADQLNIISELQSGVLERWGYRRHSSNELSPDRAAA